MSRPVSALRRPEIVEALRITLSGTGLSMPSNDEVAKAANMSRQLIRHYFPQQREIAVELARRFGQEYQELLTGTVCAAGTVSRLQVFLDFYFGVAAPDLPQKPADDHVYDALLALAVNDSELRDILREQYSLLGHIIGHEIHLAHPGLGSAVCRQLGDTIVALMYGHWKMVGSLGFSADHNRFAREAVDRLIASYVADPPVETEVPPPDPA
jgi:AcrR family transcriptional regulator